MAGWAAQLKERGALLVQTVYECSACAQRYLGSRRCDECQLFCRNLGPGATCASCDEIITVAELLGVANRTTGGDAHNLTVIEDDRGPRSSTT